MVECSFTKWLWVRVAVSLFVLEKPHFSYQVSAEWFGGKLLVDRIHSTFNFPAVSSDPQAIHHNFLDFFLGYPFASKL